MKTVSQKLYQSMLQDIDLCKQKQLHIVDEIECCFQICNEYWTVLRERVAKYEFSNREDEIEFFKKTKPLFTSEVEYFSLLSYAELTRSEMADPVELQRFWNKEALRLEKFINKSWIIYDYYKNGNKYHDEQYFIRANSNLSNFLESKAYQDDDKTATSHDYLIARIMALEKYHDYVKRQLEEVKKDS
jgi:hypothetical protein